MSCKKLHFFTFEIQGQLSKVSKAKISVTSMKLHFITSEVKGPRSISKVNYPKYLKQKFRWPLWNYTSLHLRSKVKVNYPKYLKQKFRWPLWNYTSLHLRSKVQGHLSKVSKAKISVTSMKLDSITFEVQVQLSKVSNAKISVTSMKLHFITFEVNGPRSISKVNYPKYLKQKFRWPLFSWKYTSSGTKK